MREVDLLVLFVIFVHREVDDPGKLEAFLVDQVQLLAEPGTRKAGELPEFLGIAGHKEGSVALLQAKLRADRRRALGADVVGKRAGALAALAPHDVAETGLALALSP